MPVDPATDQGYVNTLLNFWKNPDGQGLIDSLAAMQSLVSDAADYDASRQIFTSNFVFSTALLSESADQDSIMQFTTIPVFANALSIVRGGGDFYPPRWYMLHGIKTAEGPGWFSDGDPTGVGTWIGSTSVSGGAIAYTISNDPDPNVRIEALDLLRTVSFPVEWVPLLKTGLDKLDATLVSSSYDQSVRSVIAALSAQVRSRVFTVANLAASTNFAGLTIQMPDSTVATMPPPPGRPWYQRIELYAGALGGVFGGAFAAERRRVGRRNRR